MRRWLIGGLTIAGSFLAGALVPLLITAALVGTGAMMVSLTGTAPDPQEQYYRGVYDACRWLSVEPPTGCMEMTSGFAAMKMYREESPGWVWPDREVKALPIPQDYPAQQTPAP